MKYKKIIPRIIKSVSKLRPTVNPYGYAKRMIQITGPLKRISTGIETAYQKFAGGYSPTLQLENKKMIRESINAILKKHASTHVNKYMRSGDGKVLKQEVNQLIRMKLGKKTI